MTLFNPFSKQLEKPEVKSFCFIKKEILQVVKNTARGKIIEAETLKLDSVKAYKSFMKTFSEEYPANLFSKGW